MDTITPAKIAWGWLNIRSKATWLFMKAVIGGLFLLFSLLPMGAAASGQADYASIKGENASIKEENSAIKGEGASIKENNTARTEKGTSIKEKKTITKGEDASIKEETEIIKGENASIKADSTIIKGANDPHFITASIVTASPGRDIYSVFGHTAIRMQCPSAGLDYCFSFAMATGLSGFIDFFSGNAQGAFQPENTKEFLEMYRKEGRGVREDTLNLSPKEKQELWRKLDEDLTSGARRKFDLLQNKCTSTAIAKIESVLMNEYIDFGKMPELMYQKDGRIIMWASRRSPWAQWIFMTLIGSEADRESPDEIQLSPEMLITVLKGATIRHTDPQEGAPVPVIIGRPHQLVAQTIDYPASPLRPEVVFGALLAMAIALATGRTLYLRKEMGHTKQCATHGAATFGKVGHYIYKVVGWSMDSAYMIASLTLLHITVRTGLFGLNWNWLLLAFNPLPLILWICLRKKDYYYKVYAFYAVWLAAFIVVVPWFTEQLLPSHYLLAATMAVICAGHYIANRCKAKAATQLPYGQ